MALRQRFGFLMDGGQSAVEIGLLESIQCAVGRQRLIQFTEHAHVVNDVTEVFGLAAGLVFIQPIHPGDGLQEGMIFKSASEVEHRVAGSVEAGQQLVDHDQNFWLFAVLECVDDILVVAVFRPVAFHHPLPEGDYCIGGLVSVDFIKSFALVRRGNDHLAGHCPQFIQESLVAQCRGLIGRYQLCLEASPLPVLAKMLTDVEGAHVNHLLGLVQHFRAGVFPLEIRFLLIGQSLRMAFEPDVDGSLVLFEFYHPPLIE